MRPTRINPNEKRHNTSKSCLASNESPRNSLVMLENDIDDTTISSLSRYCDQATSNKRLFPGFGKAPVT